MISFSKLGAYGQLGNQLFEYAFTRVTARRLKTTFYCPRWDGDDIFELRDSTERSVAALGIVHVFDSHPIVNFNPLALEVGDHTDIRGFFQSDKYFDDKAAVRKWFQFKDAIAQSIARHFPTHSLKEQVSVSIRLGKDYAETRNYFPLYPLSYYREALRRVDATKVLVFSDEPQLAEAFFRPLAEYDVRVVTELNAPESLYLLTQCRANVINNSTFAWWGAWLNQRPGHSVVAPKYWTRPGVPQPIKGLACDDWIQVNGTVPIWDHFQVWRIRHPRETLRRVRSRLRANTAS